MATRICCQFEGSVSLPNFQMKLDNAFAIICSMISQDVADPILRECMSVLSEEVKESTKSTLLFPVLLHLPVSQSNMQLIIRKVEELFDFFEINSKSTSLSFESIDCVRDITRFQRDITYSYFLLR